jgi:hypothetical protein
MRLALICSNDAEGAAEDVASAVALHRLTVRELVSLARKCDDNRKAVDDFAALRMERLSEDEQLALTSLAEAPVRDAAGRRAKAMYLAELLEGDPECMKPEDLVAAFRSLAESP